jgi:putative aldouronate transport system substrate-binding protein
LINPEAFTQDFASMVSLAAGTGDGVARVGMQIFWDIPSIFGSDITDQYIVLPPMKVSATSTDDVRYSYETFKTFSSSSYAIAISENCADKEAAMRFLDAFYAPKASAEALYGGVADGLIRDAGDGTYDVLPPADPSFSGTIWMWTNTMGPIAPYYVYDGLLNNAPDTDNAKIEKSVYDEAHDRIDFTKDFFGYMYFKMDADDINTLALNAANFQIDWVNWVMNGGVDEAWDAHVQSMIDNGLQQNIEIYQEYYNDYVASMN